MTRRVLVHYVTRMVGGIVVAGGGVGGGWVGGWVVVIHRYMTVTRFDMLTHVLIHILSWPVEI